MAIPFPPNLPRDLLISRSAMWPRMIAPILGTPNRNIPNIAKIRDVMAFLDVVGFIVSGYVEE